MPGGVSPSAFAEDAAQNEKNVKKREEDNLAAIRQKDINAGGAQNVPNSEAEPQAGVAAVDNAAGVPLSVAAGGTGGKAPADPWEQLTNQLTAQYSSLLNEFQPTAMGQTQGAMDQTMSSDAQAMLGSSGGPLASWMSQITGAAQAQGAPLTAAMAKETQAADIGAKGEMSALQAMGKASDQQMTMAPYDQLLSSLAGEVPYLLAKGNLPASNPLVANAPHALQWIEGNMGVTSALPTAGGSNPAIGGLPAPTTAANTSAVPVNVSTTTGTQSPAG